jgi:RNA polymerase sigma factor (sigma-70 family)
MQELVLNPGRALDIDAANEDKRATAREEFERRLGESAPLAFRVAMGVLRNAADAEDVAQEALLRAYRKFRELRKPEQFRSWLVRIAFRLALDRWRSARRRELRETAWSKPISRETSCTSPSE